MADSNSMIEKLYDCAQVLSGAKDKIGEHKAEFQMILDGVKGDTQSKRLASQFIARFSPKFPEIGDISLDAILDLCEDDDINIRKQAIKDLPLMCRERKEYLPKIADVLTQLLQTDESSELGVIQNSLMSLLRKDCKGTLIGIFCQVKTGGDIVRQRALKFLFLKLKTESKDLLNKEGEVHLFEEIKACTFEGCTSEEFHMFMTMLSLTSIPKTVAGQSMIVEMISKMVDFERDFKSEDEEAVDRVVQCFRASLDYFSKLVKSTKFCQYLCLRVLPEWDAILSTDQGKLLKILGEVCMNTSDLENPETAAANIHTVLMEYLPQAPAQDGNGEAAAEQFEFTKVECLLFALHTVAQMSKFFEDNQDTLKELKTRLQHFALGIQGYMRKLREHLNAKSKAELTTDENKLKAEALKSATNINSLIKDFLHTPPSFKTTIFLSWKPTISKEATKRKSISFDDKGLPKSENPKRKFAKTPLKASFGGGASGVYAPPTGKYSGGIGKLPAGGSGGKRGGRSQRGGGRLRGGGRKKSF